VKNYEVRIARLENILGPRRQKASLLLLVDLLVQTKKEQERQERSSKRRPPKVTPDEGGKPAVCGFCIQPTPPEKTEPPPAYTAYMTAQAAQVQAQLQPAPPATPKARRRSSQKASPVMDMCVFPAHWKFNRGQCAESEDEQRRRVPPLVI
jgi:pyruvate/2-oxoglutarate dehydrogenase complex dihydrolipoamide acyltransferase (E2) component